MHTGIMMLFCVMYEHVKVPTPVAIVTVAHPLESMVQKVQVLHCIPNKNMKTSFR